MKKCVELVFLNFFLFFLFYCYYYVCWPLFSSLRMYCTICHLSFSSHHMHAVCTLRGQRNSTTTTLALGLKTPKKLYPYKLAGIEREKKKNETERRPARLGRNLVRVFWTKKIFFLFLKNYLLLFYLDKLMKIKIKYTLTSWVNVFYLQFISWILDRLSIIPIFVFPCPLFLLWHHCVNCKYNKRDEKTKYTLNQWKMKEYKK